MSGHETQKLRTQPVLLDLTEAEIRALLYFKKQHYFREPDVTLNQIAGDILRLALLHPYSIHDWMNQMVEYCVAEGMNQQQHMLGCITAQKRYRRIKMTTA